ncbi:MAG: hypothetical protein A3G27_05960 [Betaproteobacteria bacterium RIFCSPLOWO2_12_FULL_66_14]|nr:MAG: hypothetical protein A3G27_05960 [Betaproteobacteria bacterium RIFCSPLOWO2_12_FULL_66_14]
MDAERLRALVERTALDLRAVARVMEDDGVPRADVPGVLGWGLFLVTALWFPDLTRAALAARRPGDDGRPGTPDLARLLGLARLHAVPRLNTLGVALAVHEDVAPEDVPDVLAAALDALAADRALEGALHL